jgi:nicotinamidase-related amidase
MNALLVIDAQNGLMSRQIHNKELLIETLRKAIDIYRKRSELVVFVQHTNSQMAENTQAWAVVDELGVGPDEVCITKKTSDAFGNSALASLLRERTVDTITTCGLVTHGCVAATSLGGLKNGFGVRLLRNGHSLWGKDAEAKIASTEAELAEKGVTIVAIDEL